MSKPCRAKATAVACPMPRDAPVTSAKRRATPRPKHKIVINRTEWGEAVPQLFTVEDANRLLPQLEQGLGRVHDILSRLRDVRDQLADLRIIWGPRVEAEDCPDHAEYEAYLAEFRGLEADLNRALSDVQALGCQVKDPDQGLVDFYTDRHGEPVYLCWKRGEPSVQYWHSLEGGYSGRRSINSL